MKINTSIASKYGLRETSLIRYIEVLDTLPTEFERSIRWWIGETGMGQGAVIKARDALVAEGFLEFTPPSTYKKVSPTYVKVDLVDNRTDMDIELGKSVSDIETDTVSDTVVSDTVVSDTVSDTASVSKVCNTDNIYTNSSESTNLDSVQNLSTTFKELEIVIENLEELYKSLVELRNEYRLILDSSKSLDSSTDSNESTHSIDNDSSNFDTTDTLFTPDYEWMLEVGTFKHLDRDSFDSLIEFLTPAVLEAHEFQDADDRPHFTLEHKWIEVLIAANAALKLDTLAGKAYEEAAEFYDQVQRKLYLEDMISIDAWLETDTPQTDTPQTDTLLDTPYSDEEWQRIQKEEATMRLLGRKPKGLAIRV